METTQPPLEADPHANVPRFDTTRDREDARLFVCNHPRVGGAVFEIATGGRRRNSRD